jgi:hypothetical protein
MFTDAPDSDVGIILPGLCTPFDLSLHIYNIVKKAAYLSSQECFMSEVDVL